MSASSILSVGIDVGTTSTHLTVSRLNLGNVSKINEPRRMVIESTEIVYRSPIYFTPLLADIGIDTKKVSDILLKEYKAAGLSANDIATGAVIVTGETARKKNAFEIVNALSDLAGRFVAAGAGPNMESVLSGRGSGAAAASRRDAAVVRNVDIGGGTTNIATFKNGALVDTQCLWIGGRCLRIADDFKTLEVTESGSRLAFETLGRVPSPGDKLDRQDALKIAEAASQAILKAAVRGDGSIDTYWFSGGVAECMSEGNTENHSELQYGDLGVLLGRALLKQLKESGVPFKLSPEPIRATVIGAGIHSLKLSGTTIAFSKDLLPIENLPLIRPFASLEVPPVGKSLKTAIESAILKSLTSQDLNWKEEPVAVCIPELSCLNYIELTSWAQALSEIFAEQKACAPLVVILNHDMAAALGQMLKKQMPNESLIVLDGINENFGDFIDIGEPLPNHQSIPVVLKDLVF